MAKKPVTDIQEAGEAALAATNAAIPSEASPNVLDAPAPEDLAQADAKHREAMKRQKEREKEGQQRCGNCRFIDVSEPKGRQVVKCRRFPPNMPDRHSGTEFLYPVVTHADWCGEWQKA